MSITVSCDRPDAVYAVGDEVVFSIAAKGDDGSPSAAGRFCAGVDNFGPKELVPRRDYDFAQSNPVRIKARMTEPGFMRLSANMPNVTNIVWSVAVSPTRIRTGVTCPPDFDDFWRKAIARYDEEVREDVRLEPLPDLSTKDLDVFKISLSAVGGRRIYGIFSRPKSLKDGPFPLRFGGKGAGPASFGRCGKPGQVTLEMNTHYYDAPAGSSKKANAERQKQENAEWMSRYPARYAEYQFLGIAASREDYFYYGVILATRRAFKWAARQTYVDSRQIAYSSTSQGGAFGLYMAALCPEIGRLVACVPALTDLCGFKAGRMSGWPRLVEGQLDGQKAAAAANAPYFDAANFAARVKCPVRFVVGFSDTTCPPCAVYAAYNSLASSDKSIIHGIGMTHLVRAEYYAKLDAWLEQRADMRMNPVFSDGVVLQRDRKVRIWGSARAGEKVRVSFAGQVKTATAAADGTWLVELEPMAASRVGRTLTAAFQPSQVTQTVNDVLVGEVWICSGQSNMDCPIWGPSPRYRDAWGALTVNSTVKPHVRLAKTPKAMSAVPLKEVPVLWQKMTPALMKVHESGQEMPSAVGYYFALELANALDVPVGLIDASWGGTHIDTWVPHSGYDGIAELEFERKWKTLPKSEFRKDTMATEIITAAEEQPSALWNAMVNPYAPLSIRGFLWYQGCQNVKEHHRYAAKMHALYNGWSKEFRNPDLSLYFAQLAPWGNGQVPFLQEAQAKFAAEEPHAAMAVINDTGNLHDIHPNDKRTVAKRLAVHALKRDYGYSWLKDESPVFRSGRVEDNRVVLSFDHADGWYVYNPEDSMRNGFELRGTDGTWRAAKILNLAKTRRSGGQLRYEGALEGRDVVLSAEGVSAPTAVRYLHSSPWFGSLYNEMGLPLGAFHADLPTAVNLFFAGDSTLHSRHYLETREYPEEERCLGSWCDELERYVKPGVRIVNLAYSGESTKSFRDKGTWAKLLAQVKAGDFVYVQFGHNDQKANEPKRFAAADGAYRDNLRFFAEQVRAKGGKPVFGTPMVRRFYADKTGTKVADGLGAYPDAVRTLGREIGVPVVDFNAFSRQMVEQRTREETLPWYRAVVNKTDMTHLTKLGAKVFARAFYEEVRKRDLEIAGLFREPPSE